MSTLGISFPIGQSRQRLQMIGQWPLWDQEIKLYKRTFADVELFDYRFQNWLRFIELFSYLFRARLRMRRCCVIKAVHLSGAALALLGRLFFHIPYVLNYAYRYDLFASIERKKMQQLLFRLFSPVAVRFASAVIVPTVSLEQYIGRLQPKRVAVIPNGVDTTMFTPPKRKSNKKQWDVLYVGRFERQKNLKTLLEAVSLVKKDCRVHFVGFGSQRERLRQLAASLGVKLIISNPVAHDKLPLVYHSTEVFVLPSIIEGHPKALLEAMSCGLPVVASRIPGCREVIDDGYDGLLVEPTPEGLRRGITRLLNDRKLAGQLGKNARQKTLSKFDKKSLMEKEIRLLRDMSFDRG